VSLRGGLQFADRFWYHTQHSLNAAPNVIDDYAGDSGLRLQIPEIGEVSVTSWDLVRGLWFLITRVAILGTCVGIPLGLAWLIGWLSSSSVQ